jgi:hypothetical protein
MGMSARMRERGKVLCQTQTMMAKPAIADATIHSAQQNKVIQDKPETKGFIPSSFL